MGIRRLGRSCGDGVVPVWSGNVAETDTVTDINADLSGGRMIPYKTPGNESDPSHTLNQMTDMQAEKLLRPDEVAYRYRVSEESVRRWIRDGDLRAIRLGPGNKATLRIPESALAKIVKAGTR